jgi:hypothetical protein
MARTAVLTVAALIIQAALSPQAPDVNAREGTQPDPRQTSEALIAVAIAQGAARDFSPIPLDQDGATTHGVVFDQFRLIARTARAAAAARTRFDAAALPAAIVRPRTVVLAYPLFCDGRSTSPGAIELVGGQGRSITREGDYTRDAAIGALLPGVQAPVASLAATFPIQTLRPMDTVRITYSNGACTGGPSELAFPVEFTPARTLEAPTPQLPPGLAPGEAPVRLQALVDLEGRLQRAVYVSGPSHLTPAAVQAIQRWRSEPPRINGAPIVRAVLVHVAFRP